MSVTKEFEITYSIKKEVCKCCNRPYEQPPISENRKFTLIPNEFIEWADLDTEDVELMEIVLKHDLRRMVEDWVYDTINFYGLSSSESLIIEETENEKVISIVSEMLKGKLGT